MQTLEAHNKNAVDADVMCDVCQSPMVYDLEKEAREQQAFGFAGLAFHRYGRPVKCSKCDYTGRKLSYVGR